MKNLLTLIATTALLTQTAQGMVAPSYFQAKKIDVAVTALASEYFNYAGKVGEAPIASIKVVGSSTVEVGIDNTVCSVELVSSSIPTLAGVPKLTAKIDNRSCSSTHDVVVAAKYSVVKAAIDKAAAAGNLTREVQITKAGKVKIVKVAKSAK